MAVIKYFKYIWYQPFCVVISRRNLVKIQSVKFIINYYLSNYWNTVFLLYIYFVYIFNKYLSITQFLHFHQKLWHWLFGTNTNVGGNKRRTVQTSDAQTSDQYKRRTSTNVGLVQTSDQYKRRTGTFIRKTSDLVDFEWTIVLNNFKLWILQDHTV